MESQYSVQYPVAISEDIGHRSDMEDRHYINSETHTYGIFDGHGGQQTVTHLEKNAYKFADLKFDQSELTSLFKEIDRTSRDGSCLLLARIFPDLYDVGRTVIKTALVGDSESWVVRKDGSFVNLTPALHDSNNLDEVQRVTLAGQKVFFGRLDGYLAVFRVIGQDKVLNPALIVDPTISEYTVQDNDQFLILACDGIREVKGGKCPINLISESIMTKYKSGITDCNILADACNQEAGQRGSMDNRTIIVINLNDSFITNEPLVPLITIPLSYQTLPDVLPASYTYLLEEHQSTLDKFGIKNVSLPCFIRQDVISRAIFGEFGVSFLRNCEQVLGGFFIWSPVFENVPNNFQSRNIPITYRGKNFPSSEHAFQAMKAYGSMSFDMVCSTICGKTGPNVFSYGQQIKLRPDWDSVKYSIMNDIQIEKFKDEKMREILKMTYGHTLFKMSPNDSYWVSGPDGLGANYLSKILMEIRDDNY